MDVRPRIQAGENAWINAEGVMMHRTISRKQKGKVLGSLCGAS